MVEEVVGLEKVVEKHLKMSEELHRALTLNKGTREE